MKFLVFSDSHGNTVPMADTIRREAPDRVLHLGDCVRDVQALEREFPALTFQYVCGNCDGYTDVPEVLCPVPEGKKIFMTHGHRYHVKSDFDAVIWAAQAENAAVLLFGHTHEAYCQRHGGLWVMNPGTCRGWGPSTYGVVLLEKGSLMCYTAAMH